MTTSVYVASTEKFAGKSAVALGIIESLARQGRRVGVFRPLVHDLDTDALSGRLTDLAVIEQDVAQVTGITYDSLAGDPEDSLAEIIAKHQGVAAQYDAVVVIGSDFTGVQTPTELAFNAQIAANLGASTVLVVSGKDRSPEDVQAAAQLAVHEFQAQHATVIAVVANRVDEQQLDAYRAAVQSDGLAVAAAIPNDRVLFAPTVADQFAATGATLWSGNPEMLNREAPSVVVAGMTLPNLLDRLLPDCTVIVASDRDEILPGLVLAHQSGTFPNLAAMLLIGGYDPSPSIQRLITGLHHDLPIGACSTGTYTTATKLFGLEGAAISSPRKVEVARRLFADHVDEKALLAALDVPRDHIRTPLMFAHQIIEQARSDRRTIVLPEATDPRILESASILLDRRVADLILLGREDDLKQRAFEVGVDIEGATIVDPADPALVERFATEYTRLRAHKGVTVEQARDRFADLSYFATMLVHLGMADGMVSGAVNTTANTIRPSLEFVKTKPGVTIVSSSFLMCLPEQVLVFADCAVIPDPTAEQLADIAISSADTAGAFGVEPRIAMLSYSTGTSGSGADVDKVRAATELVHQRAPHLLVEGPIQFDAAIDPAVGRSKMPGSAVAGQATVFIFPDLNTGNNTYKAVQRTAGAVAVGPVMQGLNKPVNDLSRGALVDDIVNTVAITAIQAQTLPRASQPISAHSMKEA